MPAPATSQFAPELSGSFDTDWQAAQTQYKQAIDSGYAPEDASQLYLQPAIQKWKIIQSSPALYQNPAKLAGFTREYETSVEDFQKNFGAYNRDGGNWAFTRTLQPTLDKWGVEAAMPTAPTPVQQLKVQHDQLENALLEKRLDYVKTLRPTLDPIDKADLDVAETGYEKAKAAYDENPDDVDNLNAMNKAKVDFFNAIRRLQPTPPDTQTATAPPVEQSNVPRGTIPVTSNVPQQPTPPADETPTQFGQIYTRGGNLYRNDSATKLPEGSSIQIGDKITTGQPLQPTPPAVLTPAANGGKVATMDLIKNLKQQGMDKQSAAQWLQDNGYTIPAQ